MDKKTIKKIANVKSLGYVAQLSRRLRYFERLFKVEIDNTDFCDFAYPLYVQDICPKQVFREYIEKNKKKLARN